jgi:subtilisin-like proprotein convertase family protein
MTKTVAALMMLIGLGFLALIAVGCGPDKELGGTPVPNLQPNTEITARPPDLLESSFIVSFNWTGFDPDGRVRGFQWKLSNNGNDGISVQDTLTFDPVSGDTLNPWHFTAGTDTTLLVSADLDSFPRNPEGYDRSFQTHSFFVRAVDEDGAVDSTPAYISFNATTLLPTVAVVGPSAVIGQLGAARVPPSVAFLYSGTDPDFGLGLPTRIRFLWKRALMDEDLPSEHYANSKIEVEENMGFLVSFDDSSWSPWQPFAQQEDNRRVAYDNQPKEDNFDPPRRIYYLFAAQVQDTAGAVSIDRSYGENVIHVWVVATAPLLTIFENYLGMQATTGLNLVVSQDIASGQELNFSWGATADSYAGIIESYRYGWDVLDPDDPNDSGWALAPGNSPMHRRSPTMSFSSSVHTLTIEVRDNSGQMTRAVYRLSVVQAPPPEDQLPLLLVDDVFDRQSNGWVGPAPARLPLDNDIYRDEFYLGALTGSGGVVNFDVGRDIVDIEADAFNYRSIVRYRAVLWNGRLTTQSFVYRNLAMYTNPTGIPEFYVDRYNWLAAYQKRIGNLLFCSTRAMNSFLPEPPAQGWALPVVFQSHEGATRGGLEGGEYAVGFGSRTLPDGSAEWIGVTRYPYLTWGISVLDEVSPNSMYVIYGSSPLTQVRTGRRPGCAGVKGVSLDGDFAARHMPGGVPFDETIFTEPTIDHLDIQASYPPYYDNLVNAYSWGDEEFYDQVIADRSTHWDRQNCANSPDGGLCLEPMFRAVARYDWIRARHLPKPDSYSNTQSIAIPDNNAAGVVRTFTVREHGDLDSLRVRVNITHPNISQLRLELMNPAGVTIALKEVGTGSGANLNGWYPTDFTPAEPLSGLYGTDVGGMWRLRIYDREAGGTGTFTSYTLETWYDDTWPVGYYAVPMSSLCGRFALTPNDQASKTNDVVVGLVSNKTAQEKPSQVGDVLWGFDPYRYDHVQMTEVIRWVLGEHFNLPMRP